MRWFAHRIINALQLLCNTEPIGVYPTAVCLTGRLDSNETNLRANPFTLLHLELITYGLILLAILAVEKCYLSVVHFHAQIDVLVYSRMIRYCVFLGRLERSKHLHLFRFTFVGSLASNLLELELIPNTLHEHYNQAPSSQDRQADSRPLT